MKKTTTQSQNKYLIEILTVCLLLAPFLLKAETSNIYNEIITSNNLGGQVNTNGTANIEVSNTTIINGERSSYYYATSTNNLIKHDVTIVNNPPNESKITNKTFSSTTTQTENVFDLQKLPVASTSSNTTQTPYKIWSQIENVLNYLYLYVEQLF